MCIGKKNDLGIEFTVLFSNCVDIVIWKDWDFNQSKFFLSYDAVLYIQSILV